MKIRSIAGCAAAAFAALSTLSCGGHKSTGEWESMTVEQRLEAMRTDTVWVAHLDSLAAVHIGPGARCIDAVKHTFRWDGRFWVYNQDWGGVLEIPEGYVPFDDEWQAELSYHGAGIQSPDTMVYISHYEAFQGFEYEEFRQMCRESICADSLFTDVTVREETLRYKDGTETPVIIFETLNVDGIKGYFKYIYTSPESTEYSVSLQYPADCEDKYGYIKELIDRYPFGPQGQDPAGECQ